MSTTQQIGISPPSGQVDVVEAKVVADACATGSNIAEDGLMTPMTYESEENDEREIHWTPKLSVGIAEVDTQHQRMIGIYNLIVSIGRTGERKKMAELLEELGNETFAHFQYEEMLMSEAGYEQIRAHKEEHSRLLNELGEQVEDWRSRHISASELARFMYRWLIRHIVTTDVPMGRELTREFLRI